MLLFNYMKEFDIKLQPLLLKVNQKVSKRVSLTSFTESSQCGERKPPLHKDAVTPLLRGPVLAKDKDSVGVPSDLIQWVCSGEIDPCGRCTDRPEEPVFK